MSEKINKTEIKTYHISPPINFARVGNSDSDFIIGPEKPGCGPTEFKDDKSLNHTKDLIIEKIDIGTNRQLIEKIKTRISKLLIIVNLNPTSLVK